MLRVQSEKRKKCYLWYLEVLEVENIVLVKICAIAYLYIWILNFFNSNCWLSHNSLSSVTIIFYTGRFEPRIVSWVLSVMVQVREVFRKTLTWTLALKKNFLTLPWKQVNWHPQCATLLSGMLLDNKVLNSLSFNIILFPLIQQVCHYHKKTF